jgi:Zn-dependent peptidase ImmA (M78 family)
VTRTNDSSLDSHQRRAVEERAHSLLDRANAWNRFPTPIEDLLQTASVQVAASTAFDPGRVVAYLRGKAAEAGHRLKSAISKVLGLYDAGERVIHIDNTVAAAKQRFLKLHETGHHEIPSHRKIFRFFLDCEKTLDPGTADLFEREANNFARFVLFQGNTYAHLAADCSFELKTPIKLAKKFGASVYASAREYARTNSRACVVYVLEPIEFVPEAGAQARVRRIEASPSFVQRFGLPNDAVIKLDDALGRVLPIGRRMTRPQTVVIEDRNGVRHESLAEAFDTTFNVLLLLYPIRELTKPTIVVPANLVSVDG